MDESSCHSRSSLDLVSAFWTLAILAGRCLLFLNVWILSQKEFSRLACCAKAPYLFQHSSPWLLPGPPCTSRPFAEAPHIQMGPRARQAPSCPHSLPLQVGTLRPLSPPMACSILWLPTPLLSAQLGSLNPPEALPSLHPPSCLPTVPGAQCPSCPC